MESNFCKRYWLVAPFGKGGRKPHILRHIASDYMCFLSDLLLVRWLKIPKICMRQMNQSAWTESTPNCQRPQVTLASDFWYKIRKYWKSGRFSVNVNGTFASTCWLHDVFRVVARWFGHHNTQTCDQSVHSLPFSLLLPYGHRWVSSVISCNCDHFTLRSCHVTWVLAMTLQSWYEDHGCDAFADTEIMPPAHVLAMERLISTILSCHSK